MPNNILITPGSASIQFSGSAANTIRLQVEASGSLGFYGNSGSLFGISDSLSGSLMSVNDISGLPILEVFSDDRVVMGSFNRNTLVVTGSRVGIDKAVPSTDLDISGSVFITGSLSMNSGGITGSLLGTASRATSASFSTTSSYAVTAQNVLGSITSASYAATASLLLGSIESASFATTASFAISASWAPGGSGLSGGVTNYIPVWTGATAQSSSIIYQSSSRNIIIGDTTTKHPTNPPLLEINNASGETEALHLHGQVNNSYQFNIKNYTSGTSASADILVIADAGSPSISNYVVLGVNSSAHSDSGSVGEALDAYLFNTGSDLLIGNASPDKRIILFNGGNRAVDNARVYIDATGSVGINTATTTAGNPEALVVRAIASSYNLIRGEGNIDSYSQINIVNLSGGNSASADIVATANNGNESVNFIDMGINSDQYTLVNVVGAANDAYLYSTGNHLLIGNGTAAKNVVLFAGGTDVTTNQKLILAANNAHILTGSLQVSGAVTASFSGSLTGRLIGTSSWAQSSSVAISASFAPTILPTGTVSSSLQINTGSFSGSFFGVTSSMLLVEPPTDNTGAVGTAGKTWANGQFTNLTVDTALTVGDNIQLGPADQLRMGSATSFVVSHDGTNNYISSDESNLQFRDGATTRITLFRTTGNISASGGFTGSLFGTSSWASRAISSSFATTSSYALVAQTVLGSITSASYAATSSISISSSYALSASYAPGGGGLTTKAGSIANTAFTGNPRKAPVNFTTPFATTNYAIVITGEDARSWTYEGKVVGGFTASANSNTALAGTTTWIATAYGET